jgi:hypothetical protein
MGGFSRATLPVAGAVLLAVLGGCASVVSGTTQPVAVTTVCEGEIVPASACTLRNDKGSWEAITPKSVQIQKSYGDLSVACRKGQSTGTATFVSKPNSGAWGNLLAGGVIGYAVDSANGAGFVYPEEVAVVLSSPCPVP